MPAATHRMSGTPTYRVWQEMKRRCENWWRPYYRLYGGRGISFCEEWRTFENFIFDMGERPGKEYSLERRDNNGNYCKANCYWATATEQQRNKRNNRLVTYKGKTQPLAAWAEEVGLKYETVRNRLESGNWTVDQALSFSIKEALDYRVKHRAIRRDTKYVTLNGVTKSVPEWVRETGLHKAVIMSRFKKGWPPEKILTPPRKRKV